MWRYLILRRQNYAGLVTSPLGRECFYLSAPEWGNHAQFGLRVIVACRGSSGVFMFIVCMSSRRHKKTRTLVLLPSIVHTFLLVHDPDC